MTQQMTGPSPKGRPGQMTAVMRALPQATGPKVLRIGLVQGGRVIEERVIKQRTHVNVGTNEKNMFVVSGAGAPATFRLFELVGTDYHLNFVDGMSGRVALQTGVNDLDSLKGQAKRGPQGYQVKLSEDARGKVVVGDTTFLFQFVAPPPVQPRPQLPVSVQSGVSSQIDWQFTIIAAFSFLFHFGAIGMLYSDWMDTNVNEDLTIAGLLDTMKTLPPPPPVPPPDEDKSTTGDTTGADNAEKKGGGEKKGGAQGGPGKSGPGTMSSSERAALSNELDKLDLATMGSLGGQGPATAGVLHSGSDLPGGALEQMASSGAGVGASGGSGLNLGGGGGGTVRPGAAGGGLAAVGNTGGGSTASGGTETKVQGPKGNANASAQVSGGQVGNASRVVAGMRAGFRACYNQGLASNPDMSGGVHVTAQIGPNGEVRSASASPNGSISGAVASCIAARVRSAQFDPPQGGAATIVIPVTLVQQK
jgi:hypothetical protein